MPEITEIPFDYSLLSLSPEAGVARSPGLHLTDITKDMLLTSGINRAGGSSFSLTEQLLLWEQGFLWERIIEYFLRVQMARDVAASNGGLTRPGEFTFEGIHATPDAISLAPYHLEEWKATAVRKAKFDIRTHRPEWLWQAGFYANYFDMDTAVFRVWHYCQMPPAISQWKVVWTKAERVQNVERILNHAKWKGML